MKATIKSSNGTIEKIDYKGTMVGLPSEYPNAKEILYESEITKNLVIKLLRQENGNFQASVIK